jgi:hypothetical protein
VAILGLYAFSLHVDDILAQHDKPILLILFLLRIPALMLFGFAIPVLLDGYLSEVGSVFRQRI